MDFASWRTKRERDILWLRGWLVGWLLREKAWYHWNQTPRWLLVAAQQCSVLIIGGVWWV